MHGNHRVHVAVKKSKLYLFIRMHVPRLRPVAIGGLFQWPRFVLLGCFRLHLQRVCLCVCVFVCASSTMFVHGVFHALIYIAISCQTKYNFATFIYYAVRQPSAISQSSSLMIILDNPSYLPKGPLLKCLVNPGVIKALYAVEVHTQTHT